MIPKLHVLQHVSFEGAGTIEGWAIHNNLPVTKTKFFNQRWVLPKVSDIDLLVIMGGPMGVDDEKQYPWLLQEKTFIREVINADKKILGICLGAQLIASVLGAKVYPNKDKEIGWFDIEKTKDTKNIPAIDAFPDSICVFHWHGDTFVLPGGARQLFRSAACDQQGFAIGQNILGLQFHIEVTAGDILGFIENNSADLVSPGRFVQSPAQIKGKLSNTEQLRPLLYTLMDDFAQLTIKQQPLEIGKE